jgi:hypothetical protein
MCNVLVFIYVKITAFVADCRPNLSISCIFPEIAVGWQYRTAVQQYLKSLLESYFILLLFFTILHSLVKATSLPLTLPF